MKINANINITIDVEDKEQQERILNGDTSALLMTIYCGNNDNRPQLGKWYLNGKYVVNKTIEGNI